MRVGLGGRGRQEGDEGKTQGYAAKIKGHLGDLWKLNTEEKFPQIDAYMKVN